MYDIIYSVIFYENIFFINDFLKNIEYYNKNNNYLVIIHLSKELYNFRNKIYKNNLIINPIHYDKTRWTSSILRAIIDNFEYLLSKNINFNYFMPLSSSCRLVLQAPKFVKYSGNVCQNKKKFNINNLKKKWKHCNCNKFMNNKKIIDILNLHEIKIIPNQVSGRLFPFIIINEICKFIRENLILDNIECETVFCEVLLSSLHKYFSPTDDLLYCDIFSYQQIYPSIGWVFHTLKKNKNIFIIKRVPLNLNHVLFYYIRKDLFTKMLKN